MMLTEKRDLRGGDTPWDDNAWIAQPSDPLPTTRVDIAIVGAGIMGAILADRLSEEGYSIVLLDRRPPGMGSTAASSAQVMWAMDVPLCELTASIGEKCAARRWQRVYQAVRALAVRIDDLGLDCDQADRPTLYPAGSRLGDEDLKAEAILHARHGLPSRYLDAPVLADRFGIPGKPGIVSAGGFEVDPVRLVHGLLGAARSRGTRICHPCDVAAIREEAQCVHLSLANGSELSADQLILASGYERAPLFLPPEFALSSTFVMATAPGAAPAWPEGAMIWEASDPYLYFRLDRDGRIIVGGEDEDFDDAGRRDAMIGQKAGTIAAKAGALLGGVELPVDRAWAATFGTSPDGLPAIGRAANMERVWLSAGFGGNGIAFASLAADILAGELAGRPDPDARCFDPYRFRLAGNERRTASERCARTEVFRGGGEAMKGR